MRSLGITLVVLVSLLSTVVADAGLVPTKATQLVTLQGAGACPITGHPNAVGLQFRVAPDGTTSVFTIPAKQVLVLTDIEIFTKFQPAGRVYFADVLVGTTAHSTFAAYRYETVAASGTIAVHFTPSNGLVVKSGNAACIELVDSDSPADFTGTAGFANGFLASDK
jgi:hypothetical protein